VDKVVTALAAQQDDLDAMVGALDDAGWATPSRCEGWTVSDVVLHLAQTNEMAIGSVQGRFEEVAGGMSEGLPPTTSVDESAGLLVAWERGAPGADVLARWRASVSGLRAGLLALEPSARVTWVAGELSAQTLATTRLAETWIHTGDVAGPLGHQVEADDRLWHIARLAWRTLPYAFAQAGYQPEGRVTFELEAPSGDTWVFADDEPAETTISGTALDLCTVAGQRADASETGLRGEGPDAAAVLDLVRTFA
jgi:uncharacterized protein (TIGR03084 family)